MVTPTIDLRRGLEALYYFDERYFDNGANELKDRSGKRNHATASGGPTIGVDALRSFDAASFDGTDDEFDIGDPLSSDAETRAALVNTNIADQDDDYHFFDDGTRYLRHNRNSSWEYKAENEDGTTQQIQKDYGADRWALVVGTYDTLEISLIVNGEVIARQDANWKLPSSNVRIGNGYFGKNFDGEIAFAAKWSRELRQAEIEYLNRLTGPRRAIA